jgi:hypothetical protein
MKRYMEKYGAEKEPVLALALGIPLLSPMLL